jgi:hypothetical protein
MRRFSEALSRVDVPENGGPGVGEGDVMSAMGAADAVGDGDAFGDERTTGPTDVAGDALGAAPGPCRPHATHSSVRATQMASPQRIDGQAFDDACALLEDRPSGRSS